MILSHNKITVFASSFCWLYYTNSHFCLCLQLSVSIVENLGEGLTADGVVVVSPLTLMKGYKIDKRLAISKLLTHSGRRLPIASMSIAKRGIIPSS